MVDPKELRIGNWIQTNSGILKVVNGINYEWEPMEHIVYDDTHIGYSNDELSPIPITPEWLERLGFKSDQFFDDTRPIFYLGDFYIDWDTLQPQDCGFDIAKIKIKYIHQLQNLYHALTGQELTVKELTAI